MWQQNPNSRHYFWESSHRVKAADSALGAKSQIVGGACSLGFGAVEATILVTVVILAACFAVCPWSRYISRTPCTGLVWINE